MRCVPSDMPICLPRVTIRKPTLLNALTARSAETSVKSTLDGNLYLINRGVLCLFLYHVEVGCNGVLDIFDGLFKGVALTMAAGKGRAMSVETVFCFVYDH